MRSNLTPTTITDKNGKITTVHRRAGGTLPAGAAKLSGVKPTLGSVSTGKAPASDKQTLLGFPDNSRTFDKGSFLDRVGVAGGALSKAGSPKVKVSQNDIIDFLKLGIPTDQATYLLVSGGTVSQWMQDDKFRDALPGDICRVKGNREVSVKEAVELMEAEGLSHRKMSKLLDNGFCDDHLEATVLNPQEMFTLFDRFTYQPSVDPNKKTNAAMTMEAFMKGQFPFELAESMDADRATMTSILYALYPPNEKRALSVPLGEGAVSQPVREELINDHRKLADVVYVMSKHKNYRLRLDSLDDTLAAIKNFGADACISTHPNLLNHRLSNGELLSPERVKKAKSNAWEVGEIANPGAQSGNYYPSVTHVVISKGRDKFSMFYSDLAEFDLMGYSPKDIYDKTIGAGIDSSRALAIANKNVSPAVSSGWL